MKTSGAWYDYWVGALQSKPTSNHGIGCARSHGRAGQSKIIHAFSSRQRMRNPARLFGYPLYRI